MLTIHFSDEYEQSVQGSPWALMLYQREFKDDGKNADFYADFVGFLETIEDIRAGNAFSVDFTFLLKTAWAMAKNADDSIPDFETWARESDISMDPSAPWMMEVQDAIFAELFRRKPKTPTSKGKSKGSTGRRTNSRKANPSS